MKKTGPNLKIFEEPLVSPLQTVLRTLTASANSRKCNATLLGLEQRVQNNGVQRLMRSSSRLAAEKMIELRGERGKSVGLVAKQVLQISNGRQRTKGLTRGAVVGGEVVIWY